MSEDEAKGDKCGKHSACEWHAIADDAKRELRSWREWAARLCIAEGMIPSGRHGWNPPDGLLMIRIERRVHRSRKAKKSGKESP